MADADGRYGDGGRVIPLIAMRGEFPTGVVNPYLVGGLEVDVQVITEGDLIFASLLPFENQGPTMGSSLLSALLKKADALGQEQLEQLPVVGRLQTRVSKSLAEPVNPSRWDVRNSVV